MQNIKVIASQDREQGATDLRESVRFAGQMAPVAHTSALARFLMVSLLYFFFLFGLQARVLGNLDLLCEVRYLAVKDCGREHHRPRPVCGLSHRDIVARCPSQRWFGRARRHLAGDTDPLRSHATKEKRLRLDDGTYMSVRGYAHYLREVGWEAPLDFTGLLL